MRVSIQKPVREMTADELKQYKHAKYKSATYEINIKLVGLSEEQFTIIANILKEGV